MAERDEEGRPVATPNAGAFLAPIQGVPPVPSSVIDQRGASLEHVDEAEVERRGSYETTAGRVHRTRPMGTRRLLAFSTSLAVWSLCYAAFFLVLEGTAWVADYGTPTAGMNLLRSIHVDVIQLGAYAAFLALGAWAGAAHLPSRRPRSVALLAVVTLPGAFAIGFSVSHLGAAVAVIVIACALACLAVVHQTREL